MSEKITEMLKSLDNYQDEIRESCRELIEKLSGGECDFFDCYKHIVVIRKQLYDSHKEVFDNFPSTISLRVANNLDNDVVIFEKTTFLSTYDITPRIQFERK